MELVINIPEEQAERLEQLQRERHSSRDQLLREALDLYLPLQVAGRGQNPGLREPLIEDSEERSRALQEAFGSWKNFPEDAVAYQQRLRDEWIRDWDPEWLEKQA